jgi:hypothetical protein
VRRENHGGEVETLYVGGRKSINFFRVPRLCPLVLLIRIK